MACNFIKRKTPTQVFVVYSAKFLRISFVAEHLRATGSEGGEKNLDHTFLFLKIYFERLWAKFQRCKRYAGAQRGTFQGKGGLVEFGHFNEKKQDFSPRYS